jgi:hypothetical protein
MLTQLQTPIPLDTPKGAAWAVAIIDYGPQWDLQWVTFLKESGECWTFQNSEIRQPKNFTFGVPGPEGERPVSPATANSNFTPASNITAPMRPNFPGVGNLSLSA